MYRNRQQSIVVKQQVLLYSVYLCEVNGIFLGWYLSQSSSHTGSLYGHTTILTDLKTSWATPAKTCYTNTEKLLHIRQQTAVIVNPEFCTTQAVQQHLYFANTSDIYQHHGTCAKSIYICRVWSQYVLHSKV